MSTLNGEPYPGFFRDEARVMKDQNKNTFNDLMSEQRSDTTYAEDVKENEKGPTCLIADSYAHRYGPDDKPEVGATHMYDYMTWVYDGNNWRPMTDKEWLTDESPKEDAQHSSSPKLTSQLTLAGDGDTGLGYSANDTLQLIAGCDAITNVQISDSSSFQEIDIVQMSDDIASMKEMLHKLLGNKTTPAPEQGTYDFDPGVTKMADEIDQTVLAKLISESNNLEIDYDRAMNKMENDRG